MKDEFGVTKISESHAEVRTLPCPNSTGCELLSEIFAAKVERSPRRIISAPTASATFEGLGDLDLGFLSCPKFKILIALEIKKL